MKLKNIMLFIFMIMIISVSFSQTVPQLINIPGGTFIMGYDSFPVPRRVEDDSIPLEEYSEHVVSLDSFRISKYEITFTEFFEFFKDTGYISEAEKEWDKLYPEKIGKESIRHYYNDLLYPDHPATWINYEDALMYCLWLSRKTGRTYRLPTEAEWEYAATGGEMVLFPWGNEYRQLDSTHAINDDVDTTFQKDVFTINQFFEDVSTFGVYGTYGNVKEWCLDAYDPEYYKYSTDENPLQAIRKYENYISTRSSVGYAKKGSSSGIKARGNCSPFYNSSIIGFRIVEEINTSIFNKNMSYESSLFYADGESNSRLLNVRNDPSLEGMILFQLKQNEQVRIYLRTTKKFTVGELTDYWYCIRRLDAKFEKEMTTGWVFGAYLNIEEIKF